MPFFGRNQNTTTSPPPTTTTAPKRSSTLFSRRRSVSPPRTTTTTTHGSGSHNLLHRGAHEDASIVNARERVLAAETAERDADRALMQAKAAVKQAREHVKALEREAAEQARLAKIKQHQAGALSKRAKPLGRKFL